MPRTRKLISRMMGNTPEHVMKEAVSKIHNDSYGLRQASKVYGIPATTLRRYLLKFKQTANSDIKNCRFTPNYSVNIVFSMEVEEELKEYLILSSKIHHGLTKKVNFKPHMLNETPAETADAATKSGWINGSIFLDVFKHFANHVKYTKDNLVILFMDNHESHVQLEAITFAKDNGIILITFPPHTSIWPLHRNIFSNDDFLSSYVSDRNEHDVSTINHENQTDESANNCTVQELGEKTPPPSTSKQNFGSNFKELTDSEIRERTPEPSTSKENCHSPKRKFISSFVIRPLQKAGERKTTNKRQKKNKSENISYHDTDDSMDAKDFTVKNEDFPTEHNNKVGQFVLVCKGEGLNKIKMYSVGEITEISNDDIAVNYFKRLRPFFLICKN
ncbi:hypothetical protein ILUMI_25107 [Ignelater luminosus]|uniref:HTH psq-type domain-containing protein n=1 Tax=Ignelater luminosus TaxID=2038154 RepID=A0A8K0C977_IGNLU|nr:hypothetical protein ILUMI_25107 [Ignelater luminosus]